MHSKNEENSQYQNSLVGAYEKEIETILREANNVISRQKEALDRAKEGNSLKDKMRELEDKHVQERKES